MRRMVDDPFYNGRICDDGSVCMAPECPCAMRAVPPLAIHGAALHAMAEGKPEEAAQLSGMLAQVLRDRRRLPTRMLQALDAYWLHCEGLPKGKYPRGRYTMEDWWGRF